MATALRSADRECAPLAAAEWIARQLTEASGWQRAPRYIIRDRDRAYGEAVLSRLQAHAVVTERVVNFVLQAAEIEQFIPSCSIALRLSPRWASRTGPRSWPRSRAGRLDLGSAMSRMAFAKNGTGADLAEEKKQPARLTPRRARSFCNGHPRCWAPKRIIVSDLVE
jgi:hypothetical protein